MKERATGHPNVKSPSHEIDIIIEKLGDWRGEMLAGLRADIKEADLAIIEEVKWKKPSNPAGVPVWSHDGIICVANPLKAAVRLTFPKGARMKDPRRLFNIRLDSGKVRAIDFHQGEKVDKIALRNLIVEGVGLNTSKPGRAVH